MWQSLNNPNQAWKLINVSPASSILDTAWKLSPAGRVSQEFLSGGTLIFNGNANYKWSWYDEKNLIMKTLDPSKKVAYYKFSIVCEDSITIEETTSSPEKNQWYPPKKYTTN